MAVPTLVSVQEYLSTTYRPDCDYVDGVIEERNVGEVDHSRLQALLILFFGRLEKQLGICVLPEVRVQVKETRFRVPDICVVRAPKPEGRVLRTPPLLCIEILSPEDRMAKMHERIADYLEMGVPAVWVINPGTGTGWSYTVEGAREARDGLLVLPEPEIILPLAQLMAGM
jgi:Uma2 family endonuclease